MIAALQKRIAEIAENKDGLSGLILLSSFQHDAVENAAAKTSGEWIARDESGAAPGGIQ